jgi:hypothetical protein
MRLLKRELRIEAERFNHIFDLTDLAGFGGSGISLARGSVSAEPLPGPNRANIQVVISSRYVSLSGLGSA